MEIQDNSGFLVDTQMRLNHWPRIVTLNMTNPLDTRNRSRVTLNSYVILEKRRPNGRFFLGPAGTCLGFALLLSFPIWGMAAWGAVPSPPPKSFLQSSKSLEHWRTEIVLERSLGLWMPGTTSLLVSMSFNPSRYHLSSNSGIRPLEDRKSSWEESWSSGHPYECQEQFLF